jgi:hypothetical protein
VAKALPSIDQARGSRGGKTLKSHRALIFAMAASRRSATGGTEDPSWQHAMKLLQNSSAGDAWFAKDSAGAWSTGEPGTR